MTMANATELKFGDPATRVAQTDRWSVLVRPRQPTLGSLVLVCREPVLAFAGVSPAGFAELECVSEHDAGERLVAGIGASRTCPRLAIGGLNVNCSDVVGEQEDLVCVQLFAELAGKVIGLDES